MPAEIAVTEIEDVLLAKMVCALQISASCLNKDCLTSFSQRLLQSPSQHHAALQFD